MIISLICIGFSSWNITNQIGGQSLTGSIKADNVINSSEYIDFDLDAEPHKTENGVLVPVDGNDDGLEIFDYCADGFIVQNTISKTATLKAHYVIKLGSCKTTFKDYTSLKVVITLRGTNGGNAMTFFDGQTVVGASVKGSVINYDESVSVTTTDDPQSQSYTFTINFQDILTIDNNLDTYKFTVLYTFRADYFSSFYAQINNEPLFHTSAKITGVN